MTHGGMRFVDSNPNPNGVDDVRYALNTDLNGRLNLHVKTDITQSHLCWAYPDTKANNRSTMPHNLYATTFCTCPLNGTKECAARLIKNLIFTDRIIADANSASEKYKKTPANAGIF